MGLARSTYYDAPKRAADDTALVEAMAAVCDAFEAYGWRRVQAALRQQGLVVNHKKVRRLMREHDLQPRVRPATSPPPTAITVARSSRTLPRTSYRAAPINSGSRT